MQRHRRMAEIQSERASGGPDLTLIQEVADDTLAFEELVVRFLAHEGGPGGRMSSRTLKLRETLLAKHVTPLIGHIAGKAVTTPHVQALIDRLVDQSLSGSSVRGIIASISCVMKYATIRGYVPANPCREVQLPSGERQSEPRYLKHEDAIALIESLSDEFRPVSACSYFAALRVSEALALTWDCIDFDGNRITVREGKTKASAQDVPMVLPLRKILKAHHDAQRAIGIQLVTPDARVFVTATGEPQGRRNALRAVNRASEKLGLWSSTDENDTREPVGLHDLRHSWAAHLRDDLHWSARDTSRFLRHANESITKQIYGGWSDEGE